MAKSSEPDNPYTVHLFRWTVRIRKGWWTDPRIMLPIAVVLTLVLYTIFGDDGIYQSMQLRGKIQAVQGHLDSLQNRNDLLRQRITRLKNQDPSILEEEARGIGMVKEGERVYIIEPERKEEAVPVKKKTK